MKILSTFIVIFLTGTLWSQVINDECVSAIAIDNSNSYCSGSQQFSNDEATSSFDQAPFCWNNDNTVDVWYYFRPQSTGLQIKIYGQSDSNDETLRQYSIGIYESPCENLREVLCGETATTTNFLESRISNLIIGQVYYIRVASNRQNTGTFELCLEGFTDVPSPEQDCPTAVILCDKSPFVVDFLTGGGIDDNELVGTCLDNPLRPGITPTETSSAWYKWTAQSSGTLTFTLTPTNDRNPEEDLDFVVYRLPNGINDCRDKEAVRCMASGESEGESPEANAPCFGPTGLAHSSRDVVEVSGCQPGDDNFVAALDMVAGESYALAVNNYSRSGHGFSITMGGTGTFRGPQVGIDLLTTGTLQCDQLIAVEESSITMSNDEIVEWNWIFGADAEPQFASGSGQQEVTFSSFGEKTIALTITTSRGCKVTETIEIDVEPCCPQDSDLSINVDGQNLSCYESNDGRITVEAFSGLPDYRYSINNGTYQPNSVFDGLPAGNHNIIVQDAKGCEVMEAVALTQPAELQLSIEGPVDSINLGKMSQFFSTYGPDDRVFSFMWSPPTGLSCTDCPDPMITSSGTMTYTLTITDQDGCQRREDILLLSRSVRNYYAPNALHLHSGTGNDEFKIITEVATEVIEELSIYDRYGGLMYQVRNIIFDEDTSGWDGTVNGRTVVPGIYTWVARIRYVDQVTQVLKGTISVIQ